MAKHANPRNVPHKRERDLVVETNARRERRIAGASGTWPVRIGGKTLTAPPKPPPICFLYEDLAEIAEFEPPAPVFGQYPRALIGKLLPWLRCERREVLHVCSGSLPRGEGIRVDIRADARPDILADGRALPLPDGSAEAVMLDPPYTEHYARDLYGVDYPVPSHLLREAARVVRPCGRIVFVHYFTPNPPPRCHVVKVFGLSTGFGFPMRAVMIYQKEQASLCPSPS